MFYEAIKNSKILLMCLLNYKNFGSYLSECGNFSCNVNITENVKLYQYKITNIKTKECICLSFRNNEVVHVLYCGKYNKKAFNVNYMAHTGLKGNKIRRSSSWELGNIYNDESTYINYNFPIHIERVKSGELCYEEEIFNYMLTDDVEPEEMKMVMLIAKEVEFLIETYYLMVEYHV